MTRDVNRVNVAISGMGRIGRYHSMNIINRVREMNLVAGCSVSPDDIRWAKENLEPYGVKIYDNYETMLEQENRNIDAVLIASSTSVHAEQSISAIEKGYNVFCEKPLATTVEAAEQVVEAAEKKPHLKVLCGFSRRFDDSYRDAKKKVDEGLIGDVVVVRSQTCDKQDETGFFVKYAKNSGGIIVDCSIHDLDLILYFLGEEAEAESMSAIGTAAIYPELTEWNDADNALGLIKFRDGRLANIYASRMMTHGQDDCTEIIGTKGKITVNKHPQVNLATISDRYGVRNEAPSDFYGRFELAFVNEMNAYAGYILNDKPVPFSLRGNVKVLKWANQLQECLETGKSID